MRQTKGMRLVAVFVCVFLLAFVTASAMLEVRHAGHDCLRESCTVCMVLQQLRGLLRRFSTVVLLIGSLLVYWAMRYTLPRSTYSHPLALTPILLKTRLNP